MQELKILCQNIWVEVDPKRPGYHRVVVDYTLNDKEEELYAADKSNSSQQKKTSIALFTKQQKAGLTDQFQEQITKSIEDGHIEVLSATQAEQVQSRPHYFSGINFHCKQSSKLQKLCVVINSSSSSSAHVSKASIPTALRVGTSSAGSRISCIHLDLASMWSALIFPEPIGQCSPLSRQMICG